MPEKFKNILIIKPSAIGDIVQAVPVLGALKKSFPDSKISWLVRSDFADLLRGHPFLDKVILFDRKRLGGFYRSPEIFGELLKFMKDLRKSRFDLVIDLQGLFRTGFFSWITGSGFRLGPADAREFAHFFYTHRIKPDDDSVHILDYYLRIVAAAGASISQPEYVLPDTSDVLSAVGEKLGITEIDSFAVIVIGSAHKDKCWSVEKFAEVADYLSKNRGLKIVAAGGASEAEQIELLKEAAETNIINLAGKTTLRELMFVLNRAKIVITNDTGPGHIAAALGTKVVMIFGRSNPARVRPYYQPDSVAAVEPDKRALKPNSKNPKHSIDNVSAEMVLDKVRKQLTG